YCGACTGFLRVCSVIVSWQSREMSAGPVIAHRGRFAGMRHILGRNRRHDGRHLVRGIGGIPMHVVGDMAMAVVPTLVVPIVLVAVVPAGVLAIDRRVWKAIRPFLRN